MPERHEFWSGLFERAHFRFYLLGKTNKSWISKNAEQREALGAALLRIVNGGGDVKILSDTTDDVIASTRRFLDECVTSELNKQTALARDNLIRLLERQFVYSVANSSHYRAVVSDDRLVFIPSLNSFAFRDEALVFELSKRGTPFEFHTYISDIDRFLNQESKPITVDWRHER